MASSLFTTTLAAAANALAAEIEQTVVAVRSRQGAGSGILWHGGQVITNHHVMPADTAMVELTDGRSFSGKVVGRDPANDLAVLDLDAPAGLPEAEAGDSTGLRVGQLVFAIGHPHGMKNVLTAGIISTVDINEQGRELIRADIQLRPGNSGGPLVDADGRVIGVNAMVAGPDVALAVPVHIVNRLVSGPAAPKIGIAGREVEFGEAVAKRAGLHQTQGVMLIEIQPASPADAAGFFPGDIVIGINGQPISWANQLADVLSQRDAKLPIRFAVLRGGVLREIVVAPVVVPFDRAAA